MSFDESPPDILTREDGATIAYRRLGGRAPSVVFLGGFMSDMTGTKSRSLHDFCAARGNAFVRFDYFGHGASSGAFAEATVGRWKDDTLAVLDHLTAGPLVLVGSSMGGWLMVLAALARPEPDQGARRHRGGARCDRKIDVAAPHRGGAPRDPRRGIGAGPINL